MTMSYQQPQGSPHQQYPPPYQPPPQQQPPQQPPKKRRNWPWIVGMIVLAFIVLGVVAAITNPNPTGSATATETAGAPATAAAKAPAKPAGPAGTMNDGVYQVGVDVQAGRYKTTGPPADNPMNMCYWSRASNDSGEFEAIIANGTPQGPGSLSVKRGEFVELSGGCTWTKVA